MTTDAAYHPNYFLRYWLLWLTAIVLLAAAATGYRESMIIEIWGAAIRLYVWQFIAVCAIFLLLAGAAHCTLDRRQITFPRWLKITHLAFSVAFCALMFIYLQVMYAERLNEQTYFAADRWYYDDLNVVIYIFLALFLLIQAVFFVSFIRFIRRR